MSDGFVQALWRFPVLGMQGEQLRSSQVDTRGIAGDRQHFASGPEGRLDAQDLPRLALWSAAFPFNPDGAIMPDRPPPFPLLDRSERAQGVPLGRSAAPARARARPRPLGRARPRPRAHPRRDHRRNAARGRARGRRDQRPAQARAARRRLVRPRARIPRRGAAATWSRPAPMVRESKREWSRPAGYCSASRSRSVRLHRSHESRRRTGRPCCASMRLLERSWRRRPQASCRRARLTARSCSGW